MGSQLWKRRRQILPSLFCQHLQEPAEFTSYSFWSLTQGLERGKGEEIRQEKVLPNWHQPGIGLHRDWRVFKIDSFSCGCLFIDSWKDALCRPWVCLLSDPFLLYLPCISTELASLGLINWRCWMGIGRWVGGRSQGTSPHLNFPPVASPAANGCTSSESQSCWKAPLWFQLLSGGPSPQGPISSPLTLPPIDFLSTSVLRNMLKRES